MFTYPDFLFPSYWQIQDREASEDYFLAIYLANFDNPKSFAEESLRFIQQAQPSQGDRIER